MAIQDIDFAKPIQKEKRDPNQENNTKKNKNLSWKLIIFFLGYTFGIYSGFQLAKLKHIEQNLIKNPDTLETETKAPEEQFSNISSNNTGEYLIFLGMYTPKKSSEIAKSLKNDEDFQNTIFHTCKGLTEKNKINFQSGIFRIPVNEGKMHKIYLGCFVSEEEARQVVENLRKIKEFYKKNLEIIQIQD